MGNCAKGERRRRKEQKGAKLEFFAHFSSFFLMYLTQEQRWHIVTLHKHGWGCTAIATDAGCYRQQVYHWIDVYKKTGAVEDEKRSGRKRKLSATMEKKVVDYLTGDKDNTTRRAAKRLKTETGIEIDQSTVRNIAHRRNKKAFRRRRSSRLTVQHKKGRLRFAHNNAAKDWSSVIFSDEHTIKQFTKGNPQHNYQWAESLDEVKSTEVERWPLSLKVWAGISREGKTDLHFYTGDLDAPTYQGILQDTLLPAAQGMFEDEEIEWEFMQDKATCHTATATKKWLADHEIKVIDDWPTKGDDINPIENLWAILDERVQKRKFTTLNGMKKVVREEWNKLDQSLLHRLIDSVSDRIRKVIEARGGHTKNIK